MSISRKLLGTLALVAGIVFLADTAAAQQDNLIDTIKKRGKIQVGFGSFLPWAIRDKQATGSGSRSTSRPSSPRTWAWSSI
jgi:hypothetical protein